MASIKYQITSALKEINQIDSSKLEFRKNNDFDNIHSIKYFKDALDTGVKFGEYCKSTFGINKLFDIKPEHYASFMKFNEQKGCTVGHLINLESHLSKLQSGMNKLSKSDKIKATFTPFVNSRVYSSSERERPTDRSYSIAEIETLAKTFSPTVLNAMQMSLNLGLRIREVCNIRVEHIVEKNGYLHLLIPKGQGKGITKGGRYREVAVPGSYEAVLRGLLNGKDPKSKILIVSSGTLRSALKRGCDKTHVKSKGWHGFRHTYARNRLLDLLGDKREVGKELIRKMLHNRNKHLSIEKNVNDHPDFTFIVEKINQVHSELGHGPNRWGLMEVYLSF
ncbi:hypothetical protein PAECIP111892_03616 [Paenibacillus auburnensis]|uniref:Tyr recombinase domain-containing protein n=1 Tax=Paenibacillus auburnensis TaxID=2905649 RepID=A0ABN8GTV2_9BACL|nr:site-specific integrase [Paenibacillus auburnensis]CAH1211654.1 hypothetical protein PAECIP111892_03616 [Paenibacillus auburnensis]